MWEQLPGMRAQSGTKEEHRTEGSLPMRSWTRAGRVLSVAVKPVEYQVMGFPGWAGTNQVLGRS